METEEKQTTGHNPVWFITGCSTGFGRELAKLVLARGYQVAATARDTNKLGDIIAGQKDRALALELDVTNDQQIVETVKQAQQVFGCIDVLVNNAGYGYLGAIEESDENEVRAMFETNFWGLAKLIHTILPSMRKRRKGCIVNISSLGGFVGFPGVGYYNASKFAVEGLSEALAREVSPFGIKVMIVEPGPFRTDWAGRSIKRSNKQIPDYSITAGQLSLNISNSSGSQPGDPVRAAQAIIKAVEAPDTPLRLLLGKMAYDIANAELDAIHENFLKWEKLTLSADFPDSKPIQLLQTSV